MSRHNIRWFAEVGLADLDQVGGKNASLGEMIGNLKSAGVNVPDGFATTADAFRRFTAQTALDELINAELAALDVEDVRAVGRRWDGGSAPRCWTSPSRTISSATSGRRSTRLDAGGDGSFAVRSSATAEDLPDASFAGQQETFLNVRGIDAVLTAIKEVFASLYNDRAIAYRVHHRFEHAAVALSAGVQRMVRSDVGASGVMFTMDTESGFPDAVFITSSYGLGRGGRAGRGEPGRVLRLQAVAARRAPRDPQARYRRQGHQDGLHRRPCGRAGPPSSSTSRAEDRGAAEPDRRGGRAAGPARADDRGATTAGRWTSSGARTASTGSSTSCRPARRR